MSSAAFSTVVVVMDLAGIAAAAQSVFFGGSQLIRLKDGRPDTQTDKCGGKRRGEGLAVS